jgi:hypothetical protein
MVRAEKRTHLARESVSLPVLISGRGARIPLRVGIITAILTGIEVTTGLQTRASCENGNRCRAALIEPWHPAESALNPI